MNGYSETNLRNPNAQLIDWGFLNDCFGGTKIRVSDIDGVTERNGSFLYLEAKHDNEGMKDGQRFTLEAFAREGHTVIVVSGRPYTSEKFGFEIWHRRNGKIEKRSPDPQTVEGMKQFVSQWFAHVDARLGWKWP